MDEFFSTFADIPAYFIVIRIHVRIKIFYLFIFFFGLKSWKIGSMLNPIRLIQYYFSDNKGIGLKEIYSITNGSGTSSKNVDRSLLNMLYYAQL
jgi:hypothetical protein